MSIADKSREAAESSKHNILDMLIALGCTLAAMIAWVLMACVGIAMALTITAKVLVMIASGKPISEISKWIENNIG